MSISGTSCTQLALTVQREREEMLLLMLLLWGERHRQWWWQANDKAIDNVNLSKSTLKGEGEGEGKEGKEQWAAVGRGTGKQVSMEQVKQGMTNCAAATAAAKDRTATDGNGKEQRERGPQTDNWSLQKTERHYCETLLWEPKNDKRRDPVRKDWEESVPGKWWTDSVCRWQTKQWTMQ